MKNEEEEKQKQQEMKQGMSVVDEGELSAEEVDSDDLNDDITQSKGWKKAAAQIQMP